MDWLENLADERRRSDPSFAEVERQIAEADEGYEVEAVTDDTGKILFSPAPIAAGNSVGLFALP